MFILMVIVFVLGLIAIALEHPFKVDKAASALIAGTLCWLIYLIGASHILSLGHSLSWETFQTSNQGINGLKEMRNFIVDNEITYHIGEIGEILFFLLGAMIIVKMIDVHYGLNVITDRIHTTNKIKLLWEISLFTFFVSAVLDNLTTTIIMIALIRKMVKEHELRWFYTSMIVLAANAGGAWTPIGDVTTIMLWIGGQVTSLKIIENVFLPSITCLVLPLLIVSFSLKGNVTRPNISNGDKNITSPFEKKLILLLGVLGLMFVPVFKALTNLPPFIGMLLALGMIWLTSEILHKNKPSEVKHKLRLTEVVRKIDVATVLFYLGILLAIAALNSAGQLNLMSGLLNEKLNNIYLIDLTIGLGSSIIGNVPLVAGAIGMYPITEPGASGYLAYFTQDGTFWEFLAYTAGTGGSILIIGSAAGVAAMGIEKIDFIWYLKRISWLALIGYLSGAVVYYFLIGL